MNILLICASLLACGWLSWFGTKKYLLIALERKLVDIPNHRSSHSIPTPRGGGIVFASVFLVGVASLAALHLLQPLEVVSLFSGALVAVVGFWDDCAGLPIVGRLLTQLLVSAIAVICVLRTWWTQGWDHPLLPFIAIAAILGFVWLINLTNFMDGIDGIATTEIICVASLCCLIVATRHDFSTVALSFALLAVSTSGFLFWNWPPASVFMGDAGSCFLGYSLGALILIAVGRGYLTIPVPLILMAVFIIDATMTLGKRFLKGERWYLPHCTHAFQHAAKRFGHLKTTSFVAVINIVWLGPLAIWAEWDPAKGWLLLVLAWLPLIALAKLLHAGESSTPFDDSVIARQKKFKRDVLDGFIYRATAGFRHIKRWGSARSINVIKALLLAGICWLALYLALLTQFPQDFANQIFLSDLIVLWACAQTTVLLLFRMYRSHWRLVSMEEIPTIAGMSLVAALSGALFAFALSTRSFEEDQQRLVLFVCLFSIVLTVGLHIATSLVAIARRARVDSRHRRRVVIFGAGQEGADILTSLRHLCPEYTPLGFVDTRPQLKGSYVCGLPVLASAHNILNTVETYGIHEVLVPYSHISSKEALALIQLCKLSDISYSIIHSIGEDMSVSAQGVSQPTPISMAVSFPLIEHVPEQVVSVGQWSTNE
jgi:Fuc2NAc and GlcNAc transferase